MHKLLFIISAMYKAGAETSLLNLLHSLSKEMYQVDLVIMDQRPIEGANSLIPDLPDHIRYIDVHEENYRKGSAQVRGKWFAKTAVDFVADKEYDLAIHVGEWWTPEFLVHCVLAKRKMAWFHADIDKQNSFSADRFFAYDDVIDKYLFVSKHSMQSACNAFAQVRDKAVLLHNCINKDQIRRLSEEPSPYVHEKKKPLIVTVANIRTEKCHVRALEAMNMLHQKGYDFTWWNIGLRSVKWIADELEEKAQRFGFPDDYLLLGAHRNPYPMLRQADALACLSDHESWSLVITEALCLGVPIVATKTSGALEQVIDGKNGVLTDFTTESIAAGIEKMLFEQGFCDRCKKNLKENSDLADPVAEIEELLKLPEHEGEHIGCALSEEERETMIHVDNLGICFRMDENKNTSLKEWIIRAIQKKNKYNDFWALRNISFDVKRGDIVGVIGNNGAGKSTLLKAISGIIEPAEGKIERRARVVPMLELGSGFDYELSGAENIFLNGAVLGYKEKFIKEHYDEIIEYAEIGDFIHMPLKVYSSGMIARLAFSIATVVKPEILIVDEILAVGDERFQQKSYKRMMELMTTGTTVLYVSHALDQVKKMCTSTLWISNGKMVDFGDTATVCEEYHKYMQELQV